MFLVGLSLSLYLCVCVCVCVLMVVSFHANERIARHLRGQFFLFHFHSLLFASLLMMKHILRQAPVEPILCHVVVAREIFAIASGRDVVCASQTSASASVVPSGADAATARECDRRGDFIAAMLAQVITPSIQHISFRRLLMRTCLSFQKHYHDWQHSLLGCMFCYPNGLKQRVE